MRKRCNYGWLGKPVKIWTVPFFTAVAAPRFAPRVQENGRGGEPGRWHQAFAPRGRENDAALLNQDCRCPAARSLQSIANKANSRLPGERLLQRAGPPGGTSVQAGLRELSAYLFACALERPLEEASSDRGEPQVCSSPIFLRPPPANWWWRV